MTIAEMRLPPNVDDKRHIALQSKCAVFLLNRKQYETLSYATQSENKLPNIQKAYIIDMSSIK